MCLLAAGLRGDRVAMAKVDRALLSRATSSEDHPTPGYMYGEIAKMSLVSYDTCKELEDYLINKVKKSNHNTKHKALLIIKHVCRHGRADFKRDMQRMTEVRLPSQPHTYT
jgi:hypothetical protein